MRFLYKIHSGYDGFTPARLPERQEPRNQLKLGWTRYIEVVEVGNEVWVYFHGPHRFTPGVYVKGFVTRVDLNAQLVWIRIRESSLAAPLTDEETTERVAEVVAPRYRQVFLYPQHWERAPNCTFYAGASSCKQRLCEECPNWKTLPIIGPRSYDWPHRLSTETIAAYVPAYWVIPSRCFLHQCGHIHGCVQRTSEMFMRFKVGEEALAFPLALGIYNALCARQDIAYDLVVPVPLSPDKEQAGEVHRTRLLAREVGRLLGTRVSEQLKLTRPISKRRFRVQGGATARQFEAAYAERLEAREEVAGVSEILVIDDVCTEGSTLRCVAGALRASYPDARITAATAGQMIVKRVVRNCGPLLES